MISDKFKAIISLTYSYVKLATFLDLYKPAANNAVNESENIPGRIAALKQRIRRILGPWVHIFPYGPYSIQKVINRSSTRAKTLYQSIIYKYIIYTSLLSCQILLSPINRQILLQFTCFSQTDSKEGYKSGKILSFQQQKQLILPDIYRIMGPLEKMWTHGP